MLYKQLFQTGSVLLLLPLSSVLGFPLYKDTVIGRAATHQLYSFAIEVWFGANVHDSRDNKPQPESTLILNHLSLGKKAVA